ncbi:MAG TPA: DUF3011 domain-containing protein [Candidatus Acidoferrales bacterium]
MNLHTKIFRRSIVVTLVVSLTLLCLPLNAQEGSLTCASNNGRYRYCRADTQNRVQLVRQNSGSRCTQGYSWGYDYRGIWVDRGCRAEFVYGRRGNGGGGSNTGAAVAAGILGAIIVGAAVSSAKSDKDDDRAERRREAYDDGYRRGQRDWDDDLDPRYMRYSDRISRDYEQDFADGYDDGYNNRRNKYR